MNLIILSDFHSFTVNEDKVQAGQFEDFSRSGYGIEVKTRKSLKLLNSVPFKLVNHFYIRTFFTLVNHFYIRTWSSWLTFTVLQWMKTNFKISQFSSFLLRSMYPIQVKIWKWLDLLNFVPSIKKTLVNHFYIRIWSSWLTFTKLQWMKRNSKISQFSSFLLRSEYGIQDKIWKWLKLLNSDPFIIKNTCKSTLHSNLIILNDFHSCTVNEQKLRN